MAQRTPPLPSTADRTLWLLNEKKAGVPEYGHPGLQLALILQLNHGFHSTETVTLEGKNVFGPVT
jgi:hypothetical protein